MHILELVDMQQKLGKVISTYSYVSRQVLTLQAEPTLGPMANPWPHHVCVSCDGRRVHMCGK